MLVGAHISPAGGLYRAVERGSALGARAIQIFNQSPRAWRPTAYGDEDFARFREALAASEISSTRRRPKRSPSEPPTSSRPARDSR